METTPDSEKQHHEPQFIGKVKDKKVQISMHSGAVYDGKIIKYNRFEILFLKTDAKIPIIVMKNFIATITPRCTENPFEKKPEEKPATTIRTLAGNL